MRELHSVCTVPMLQYPVVFQVLSPDHLVVGGGGVGIITVVGKITEAL